MCHSPAQSPLFPTLPACSGVWFTPSNQAAHCLCNDAGCFVPSVQARCPSPGAPTSTLAPTPALHGLVQNLTHPHEAMVNCSQASPGLMAPFLVPGSPDQGDLSAPICLCVCLPYPTRGFLEDTSQCFTLGPHYLMQAVIWNMCFSNTIAQNMKFGSFPP